VEHVAQKLAPCIRGPLLVEGGSLFLGYSVATKSTLSLM